MAGLSILHLDGGRTWGGGQNQVRLLMKEMDGRVARQRCLCPAGSPLHRRLVSEGLPCTGISWRGGGDPRAALAIAWALRGFDLVHCHDAAALQVAIVPARLSGARIVASRRVPFRTSALKWNRADRVIAISREVQHVLRESGVHGGRVRIIPSGIDPREVRSVPPLRPLLRQRLGLSHDAFLVGNVGSLHSGKGQEDMVQAAAESSPDVHWVVIGEGPERDALEAMIADRGVGARVHLAGPLPDARAALREMDAFAFPSRAEGLGTSILDAMAAGVPVVAADASGSAEVLRPVHAATGISLYPPGEAGLLAGRIRTLREREDARDRVLRAQNARQADFLIGATAERTLFVYRELLPPADPSEGDRCS